jgi:hypothetical protein
MGYAEAVTIISASLEVVWAYPNDIDHTPEWVTGLEAAEIKTAGSFGLSTVYYDYSCLGPTPWRITAFEPHPIRFTSLSRLFCPQRCL